MNTAMEVLVIIVSSLLSIFLIFLIVVANYSIKILKQVRRITDRAENVADSMEAAAAAFERTASPLAILRIVGNIIEQVNRTRKRRD